MEAEGRAEVGERFRRFRLRYSSSSPFTRVILTLVLISAPWSISKLRHPRLAPRPSSVSAFFFALFGPGNSLLAALQRSPLLSHLSPAQPGTPACGPPHVLTALGGKFRAPGRVLPAHLPPRRLPAGRALSFLTVIACARSVSSPERFSSSLRVQLQWHVFRGLSQPPHLSGLHGARHNQFPGILITSVSHECELASVCLQELWCLTGPAHTKGPISDPL